MTTPRQVLPGTTYLFSRRCSQRQFLLKPTAIVLHVFSFCLARAANRAGVLLHAFTVMSNHWHAVLTDVEGRLPEFAEWVHKYVAKCLNASLQRTENFWSSEHYSAIPLETREEVLEKIVYVLANPVSARLVPRARSWPGLRSTPEDYTSKPSVVGKPLLYFRRTSDIPKKTVLEVVKPAIFDDLDDEEFAHLVSSELQAREDEERCIVSREKGRFVGLRRIRSLSPYHTPTSPEKQFQMTPKAMGKGRRKRNKTIERLKAFLSRYREALKRFKEGAHDVVFPAGTYWMQRFVGVACESPG